MTLTLDLPTELEQRLRAEAARAGLAPGEFVQRILSAHLKGPAGGVSSLSDLFRQWEEADPPTDAAERAAREAEFEAFKAAMNSGRIQSEGPAARKPYP